MPPTCFTRYTAAPATPGAKSGPAVKGPISSMRTAIASSTVSPDSGTTPPELGGQLTVRAFALGLGDYSGSLLETDALMAYQLTKHFGIGGGLKYFNLNLQANLSRGGSAEFDYEFFGPTIFGYASF